MLLKLGLKFIMNKYDYLIPIGRNCEIGIQLKRFFNFVESFPYTWCGIRDPYKFLDEASCINFHAKRSGAFFKEIPSELYEQERGNELKDLKERTYHLCNKLENIQKDNTKKKLYMLTLHSIGNDSIHDLSERVLQYIDDLNSVLGMLDTNYDLLIVISNYNLSFNIQYAPNVYIRCLKYFSPTNYVSRVELSDVEGWNNIFNDFQPVSLKIEDKKYKFDSDFSNIFFKEGYLFLYPDVAKHEYYSQHPLEHYKKWGKAEGRDNGLHPSSDIFNGEEYIRMHDIVKRNHLNPWVHYVLCGAKDGLFNGTKEKEK